MKGAPDLLVIDLDGTLLGPRGEVSEANGQALAAARDAGVDVMIATGRTHAECGEILQAIDYEGPLVVASGAALVNWPSGETLEKRPLAVEDVRALVESVQGHDCAALLLKDRHAVGYDYLIVDEDELHPVSRWWFDLHGLQTRSVSSLSEDEHEGHTLRVASIGEPQHMSIAAMTVQDRLGDRVACRQWPAVGRQGEQVNMLEAFGRGVDKWSMVEVHCRRQGIDPTRVAAIGDGLNDIELLAGAGWGIAVENAEAAVLAAADARTRSHADDGVAHAVHRLLDGWS
ncbi:MAG: HAD family hydrolase [Phycisphaerales bacterium]|nr:HAD family hydrolase [Phycisphaerales bacterium]